MAASILTLCLDNPEQSGSSAGLLNTVAPTASTSTTGWTVGTTVAARWSRQTFRVEVPATGFTATAQPSGAPVNLAQDCWRISAATTGDFSAGTWFSAVSVIAVTNASAQRGRAIFSLWKSANADGTSATRITNNSNMTGSTLGSGLLTTAAQSSSASTRIGAFSLANEYLFMQAAWETTTAGTNASADALVRIGPMSGFGIAGELNGSGVVTSAFSATGGAAVIAGAGYMNEYYKNLVQDLY